jgi:hypothetical protein
MIEFGLRVAGIPCARRMIHLSTSLGTELPKGSRPARGDFLFQRQAGAALNPAAVAHE